MPSVLFVMSDYGHDPTETALPYREFKEAGYKISFSTESGASPRCDSRMLTGLTQKLLGATAEACAAYNAMLQDESIKSPFSWSDPSFSFSDFDVVIFPGGHESSVKQVIQSEKVHDLLRDYWPSAQASKKPTKVVAAICHGVLVVAESKKEDGKSLLSDVHSTTLPTAYENAAYWSTKPFLGDYYKTFGAGSESCESTVKNCMDHPETQFESSLNPGPFVVQDSRMNYVSGRWPADAALLAQKVIALF